MEKSLDFSKVQMPSLKEVLLGDKRIA